MQHINIERIKITNTLFNTIAPTESAPGKNKNAIYTPDWQKMKLLYCLFDAMPRQQNPRIDLV